MYFSLELLMKKHQILQGSTCELFVSDMIRYLLTVHHHKIPKNFRVKAIIWLMAYSKNELTKSFIKQSLLIDWLYYVQ